jgi:hypothetical protein
MREVCRVRNLVHFGGAADPAWLETADRIRRSYIDRVGLRKYILDMLPAHLGELPANQCTVRLPDGTTVTGSPRQRIIDFLLTHFSKDDLPYQLTVRNGTGQKLTHSL